MSPRKKKGRQQRHPRPRYRKQAKAEVPLADKPQRGSAPAPKADAGRSHAHREPDRREPGIVVSLDPLAPIIVRSGRPMNAHADADPARFPPPSTVAGCLRTAWARATDRPFGPELAGLAVAGPLLVGGGGRVLAPKPADALYFGHGDDACCLRAEPRRFGDGSGADLPDGLLPVQLTAPLTAPSPGKPGDGPAWWSWADLLAFRCGESVPLDRLRRNGWSPPKGDRRTHVSLAPTTKAAVARALFQTEGLDLDASPAPFRTGAHRSAGAAAPDAPDAADGASTDSLRLLVRCAEALDAGLVHLGGKRRLTALAPEPETRWPTPPDGWVERIGQARRLCLTLLTPGIFSAGFRPGWLDDTLTGSPPGAPGLTLRLRAAALGRWQAHSGWDLHRRRPRPMRKLVGAGATYWFDMLGAGGVDALAGLWLASVCDHEQDRRDGFGLALPGPWTCPADEVAHS